MANATIGRQRGRAVLRRRTESSSYRASSLSGPRARLAQRRSFDWNGRGTRPSSRYHLLRASPGPGPILESDRLVRPSLGSPRALPPQAAAGRLAPTSWKPAMGLFSPVAGSSLGAQAPMAAAIAMLHEHCWRPQLALAPTQPIRHSRIRCCKMYSLFF